HQPQREGEVRTMFEIGATLRETREQQALSLAQVEQATRMRARLLRALEEERFDHFPSDFYARSFLRCYAQFLGLDPAIFTEAYRERFAPVEDPLPQPRRRRPRVHPKRIAWATGLAAALAAILLAWTSGGGHRSTPTAAPAPPTVEVTQPTTAPARAHRTQRA